MANLPHCSYFISEVAIQVSSHSCHKILQSEQVSLCHWALGLCFVVVVYRAISTHLIHKAGYRLKDGSTGAETLIQRFGSALNLEKQA
jgi:hypothetical protein